MGVLPAGWALNGGKRQHLCLHVHHQLHQCILYFSTQVLVSLLKPCQASGSPSFFFFGETPSSCWSRMDLRKMEAPDCPPVRHLRAGLQLTRRHSIPSSEAHEASTNITRFLATKASIRMHSFFDCSPAARLLSNALRSLIGSDRLACRGTVNALGRVDERRPRMEADDGAESGFTFSINQHALTIFSFRKGGAVCVSDVQRQSTLTAMLGRIFMAGQDLPSSQRSVMLRQGQTLAEWLGVLLRLNWAGSPSSVLSSLGSALDLRSFVGSSPAMAGPLP